MKHGSTKVTIGMDLGDKENTVCVLGDEGNVKERATIANTESGMRNYFGQFNPTEVLRIAVETGTHSRWISHLLMEELGLEVLVGNARRLRVIWDSDGKSDSRDAEMLARIARFDPALLHPIRHRSRQAQADLGVLKARDALVKARTGLINHVRGTVKAFGGRISKCSAESFHRRASQELPEDLVASLEAVLEVIGGLTTTIRGYARQVEDLCTVHYPDAQRLRGINGIGPVTALGFILTLEDPERIDKTRSVGAFLGLVPRKDQSGEMDKQLRITKAGNGYLRRLLVGCAQYILGPFGPDCQLRRYGLRLAERGGRNAKRRAVVAVARKLAVLMLSLWKHGTEYEPFYTPPHRPLKRAA